MIGELSDLVTEETSRPVPEEVYLLAQAAKAAFPAGAIEAILFYGSCFRDGAVGDGMVDLYLLAGDAKAIHPSPVMRFWAGIIPPNVYYVECGHEGRTLRAKFALLTFAQFERKVRQDVRNPYFWARFAQPTGIVEAVDRPRLIAALSSAIQSLAAHASALAPHGASNESYWTGILSQTYKTELRVEKRHRTVQIYRADAKRYDTIRQLTSHSALPACSTAPWWLRRLEGRLLSVARLVKASFTFRGGPDYLAWKIERHSGVRLGLTNWQRRHPILSAGPVLWRLWRGKVIR